VVAKSAPGKFVQETEAQGHGPQGRGLPLDICRYRHMVFDVARAATTSDVFNAVADVHRREILDVLMGGERAVGMIVDDLSMSQPQVSKHLRVLSEVGLVSCRAEGRRRLYRLEPEQLQPLRDWITTYERAINDRLDRMDDYLHELQRQGDGNDS
jgi:DNA-binding transcriptional ArsR family regulator